MFKLLIKISKSHPLFFLIANYLAEKYLITSGEHYNILKFLKIEKPIIIDVGGSVGESVYKFLKINPNCNIYSFEPIPIRYKTIKTTSQEKNVRVFNYGIGKLGLVKIFTPKLFNFKFYSWSALSEKKLRIILKRQCKNFHSKFKIVHQLVKIKTLNSTKIKPDIIKIDVEGEEFQVLKSSDKIIKKYKPIILLEFNNDYKKILNFFRKNCYHLYTINNKTLLKQIFQNQKSSITLRLILLLFIKVKQKLVSFK